MTTNEPVVLSYRRVLNSRTQRQPLISILLWQTIYDQSIFIVLTLNKHINPEPWLKHFYCATHIPNIKYICSNVFDFVCVGLIYSTAISESERKKGIQSCINIYQCQQILCILLVRKCYWGRRDCLGVISITSTYTSVLQKPTEQKAREPCDRVCPRAINSKQMDNVIPSR